MFKFNIEQIEKKSISNQGSFLQTPFWCDFKSRHGWKTFYFSVKTEYPVEEEKNDCSNPNKILCKKNLESFEVSVLVRSFCKNKFSLCYIPLMPSLVYECTKKSVLDSALDFENDSSEQILPEEPVTEESQTIEIVNFLYDFAQNIKKFLPKNTICVRFDPDITFYSLEERDIFNHGMRFISFADRIKLFKTKSDIQPPDSTQIDLTQSEDEILSKMHSKWRYNIRLSQKKGVQIKKYLGDDPQIEQKIDRFYELTKETNERDGNSCHLKSYYLDLIKSSATLINQGEDVPRVTLYIAESEGEEIASIMTLFSKSESIYLYGASSNHKRNLMPNHLLQWTAIQDAKAYGSKIYDFYGMSPEGKDEKHPMHGLYMFKANFGGQNIHRAGTYDVPLKAVYNLYKIAENLRFFYFRKIKKMNKRK